MTELKSYVQERLRSAEKWDLSAHEETDAEYAYLDLRNANVLEGSQYLHYTVEPSEEDGAELTAVLEWSDAQVCRDPNLRSLEPVEQLAAAVKAAGFKQGKDQWFRYSFIRKSDSWEKLLESVLDEGDRNALFQQVSDCLCPLAETTAKLLVAANKEIAQRREVEA